MKAASPPHPEGHIPWIQRLFENIWFLLLLGVLVPTVFYTFWSIADLVILPQFGDGTSSHATHAQRATSTPAALEPGVTVAMNNMAFIPRELEVSAGTTVTWVNEDVIYHAVAYGTPDTPASEALFEPSGDFPRGESFSYTFETPGTHQIYCSTVGHYQAGMVMTVHVKEASP
jgi:plastocyanin